MTESTPLTGGDVLLASSDLGLYQRATSKMAELGMRVRLLPPERVPAWLAEGANELLIVDCEMSNQRRSSSMALLELLEKCTQGPSLVVLRQNGDQGLTLMFERSCFRNVFTVDANEELDVVELMSTVRKLMRKDIFGVGQYISSPANVTELRITKSTEKLKAVQVAESAALTAGCHLRVAQGVAMVADELVSNALYNAPLDGAGRPRYAHLHRTNPISLAEHEAAVMTVSYDSTRFCLAVSDPFGSLEPSTVMRNLARTYGGQRSPEQKEGGAGLGLYLVQSIGHHVVFNLQSHVRTEAIGLFGITNSYREYLKRGRSFNLFVADAASTSSVT